MEKHAPPVRLRVPSGFSMAPIHACDDAAPLRLCVLVRLEPAKAMGPFVLLREVPGTRIYLGAVADAAGRVQEWIEVCVQTMDLRDLAASGYQEQLSNFLFDQRWRSEWVSASTHLPDSVIATGMEDANPSPVLIKSPAKPPTPFLAVEIAPWKLCRDDALLEATGLPPYSTSIFRYLLDPSATGAKTFLSLAEDAPANASVHDAAQLGAAKGVLAVFNPHCGLVRVNRFSPIELEDYLQVLEGNPWDGPVSGDVRILAGGIYDALQTWSASPKGLPFLLHGGATNPDRLNEIFYLKLSALRDLFKEVRAYVQAQQLPLLNLAPASFRLALPEVSDPFPALWAAHCSLVKPGQAYPLKIKSTEQKYFLRLGKVEPSPFLPEGLGAHSFGVGSVRVRNVLSEADGLVIEGTVVAEDYLRVDPHDLLWFKLPLGETRVEFFAHVFASETLGRREARFRTVPMKLAESLSAPLQRVAGTVFPKSPYEIWPLLSSPCDLFSLGVIAVRTLLTNGDSNFPVVLDEVIALARHLGKHAKKESNLLDDLKPVLDGDAALLDLVSPQSLIRSGGSPAEARAKVQLDLWFETIGLVLRLFPGGGPHSFCKDFGDVSPLALETVFDQPIEELETLVLRLRSILVPGLSANEEIASVLLEQLATK